MIRLRPLFALALAAACAPVERPEPTEVRREVYLMGTTVTLEAAAHDRETALGHLEAFVRILEDTESQLSTWQEVSALSRLNRQEPGTPMTLDEQLCRLFVDLKQWHAATGGLFDPTVGALIDLWGLRTAPRVPTPEEIAVALEHTGLDHLALDPLRCQATRTRDLRLDAGAFGKGEGLDRVAASAEAVEASWMIDMGGQIMVRSRLGEDRAWAVDLAHPATRDVPAVTLMLWSGSLATSGGSERDAATADGMPVGHILDPRTGQTVSRPESVVVWHESALAADILSTALYLMGPGPGLTWAEEGGIAAAFLIPSGEAVDVRATEPFRSRFLE